MTHAQWSTTIRSKVNTSWNLHTLLPDNLDFFILLSSISGIYGSAGQSNYAAGCTFQDALARNRTASGHRASVSLDLGWMRDDGVVHESSHLQRRMAGTFSKFTPVATADLLALLDHYCDPALPPLALDQSQVVVGMTTPRETAARGGDASWALRTNLFSALDVHSIEGDGNTDPKTNGTSKEGIGADSSSFSHLFRQADTARERTKVVVTALQAKLARALGVEAEDIDSSGKGLADYGVDSLLAVELRNWMKRDFGVTLAVFEIMQGGRSIRDVAGLVGEGCERKMEA
jgi:acyl carrier protein